MATRPELHRAVQGTKNTATNYNDNFDAMMDFIDNSIDEAKSYVDDFMPSVSGQAGKVLTNDGNETSWVDMLPAGFETYWAGDVAPNGWLVRDGSAVSRITYSKLFSAIGTKYGAGDGSTTFNLPNDIDRYVKGSTTSGTYLAAGLPEIYGYTYSLLTRGNLAGQNGAFNTWTGGGSIGFEGGSRMCGISNLDFFASRFNPIYGASNTVQPPTVTKLPIIKY
jgi:hypothetical protein